MGKPNYEKCLYCGCHRLDRLADGTYEHYCYPPVVVYDGKIAFIIPCERRLRDKASCKLMRKLCKSNQMRCEARLEKQREAMRLKTEYNPLPMINPSEHSNEQLKATLLPEYSIFNIPVSNDEIMEILVKSFKEAYCKNCKFNENNPNNAEYDIATCGDRNICDRVYYERSDTE